MVQKRKLDDDGQSQKPHVSAKPLETVYVKNLNDKVNAQAMKHQLYLLGSIYGDVIDIVMKPKSHKMRGQAHIVFSSGDEAQAAVIGMKRVVFGKEIGVEISRRRSRIVKRMERSEGA